MASPASDQAATVSELSDVTTADTVPRRASDTSAYQLHQSPQPATGHEPQQTVVIVEQPPTPPVASPQPPTSLPLSDNQSAAWLSSRQTDSLPPVAEEDLVVADDSIAAATMTDMDDVFALSVAAAAAATEAELDEKSQTGAPQHC